MKTQHGYITGISKTYERTVRSPITVVDVELTVRVRMSVAEAKELDALCDDGRGTLDATVTLGRTREGSPT